MRVGNSRVSPESIGFLRAQIGSGGDGAAAGCSTAQRNVRAEQKSSRFECHHDTRKMNLSFIYMSKRDGIDK